MNTPTVPTANGQQIAALRADVAALTTAVGTLTAAVEAQGKTLTALLHAVTAQPKEGDPLAARLHRITQAIETQSSHLKGIDTSLSTLRTELPQAVRRIAETAAQTAIALLDEADHASIDGAAGRP